MNDRILIALLAIVNLPIIAFAQEANERELFYTTEDYEAPLTVDLEAEIDDEIVIKKKKPKKGVYYGIKTKKGFTRDGYGEKLVLELFSYLKVFEEPVPYVRDVYWYNFRRQKIEKSRKYDKDRSAILHGPYRKTIGDQVVEEGIYYKGVKHGRWMYWNKQGILQNKEKYYKGWPKESMVSYHNRETKKLKEIIPVHFGEKEGNYFAFHKSGNMAASGEYQFDHKVGMWREFYDIKNRRKREIVYPEDPFDENFQPYIIREWNERGKLIYENKKKR